MANGHYLEKDRLSNVIAAIQMLGVSDQTSGTLNRWVAELEASEELTPEQLEHTPIKYAERKKWVAVFEQHPEFFKTYTARGEQHVMLRWRYAQSFHSDPTKVANSVTEDQDKPDNADEYAAVSSKPLSPDQIQVLINTAIELHGKEAAAERPPDRWPPFLMAAIGAALGTVVGGTAVVLLGWMQMMRVIRIFD
jgi:hypothetical protein